METSQRYIVRELTGWNDGGRTESTDVMVLDRWDCHHVVCNLPARAGRGHTLHDRRYRAGIVQRKLEFDHRRWLAEAS